MSECHLAKQACSSHSVMLMQAQQTQVVNMFFLSSFLHIEHLFWCLTLFPGVAFFPFLPHLYCVVSATLTRTCFSLIVGESTVSFGKVTASATASRSPSVSPAADSPKRSIRFLFLGAKEQWKLIKQGCFSSSIHGGRTSSGGMWTNYHVKVGVRQFILQLMMPQLQEQKKH